MSILLNPCEMNTPVLMASILCINLILCNVYTHVFLAIAATTVRPSCWNVLTPQYNILVAVEERLYILDQHEAIPQVHA